MYATVLLKLLSLEGACSMLGPVTRFQQTWNVGLDIQWFTGWMFLSQHNPLSGIVLGWEHQLLFCESMFHFKVTLNALLPLQGNILKIYKQTNIKRIDSFLWLKVLWPLCMFFFCSGWLHVYWDCVNNKLGSNGSCFKGRENISPD